jgi:hypothetical protein
MGARLEVALPACHTDRESCLTYRLDLAGSPARNEHPTGGALRFFDIEPLPESEGGLGLVWEEVEDAAAGLPFGGEPMSEQGKLQRRQTMLCRSWLFVNGADEVELAVAPASGADEFDPDNNRIVLTSAAYGETTGHAMCTRAAFSPAFSSRG